MFTSAILFFLALIVVGFLLPKVAKKPLFGVLLLVFLTPFERIPSWEIPFSWGITVRLSQIVGLVLLLITAYQLIKGKIDFPRLKKHLKNPAIISIVIYLLVAFLSVIWAIDKEKAFLVALFTTFTFLIGFLVYFWIKKKPDLALVEKYLFYSTAAICLFGFYQFFAESFGLSQFWTGLDNRYLKDVLGFPRVQATSLEPLFLANFLLIPLGIFSALYLTDKSVFSQKKLVILIVSVIGIISLTVSRGGYLAAIILIIFILILFARTYSVKKFFKYLAMIVGGLLVAGSFVLLSSHISYGDQSGAQRLVNHSRQVETEVGDGLNTREGVWVWGFKAFKENPIKGVGAGNFGPWLGEQGFPDRTRPVNNEFLEILAETGVLGGVPIGLAVIFIIGSFIRSIRKVGQDLRLKSWLVGMFGVFIAFGAQYMTFSTLYIIQVWVMIGLLLAIYKLALKQRSI